MTQNRGTDDLVKKGLSALRWSYLGVASRAILQVLAQIVLARLIGPEGYGVFSISILICGLVFLLAECGVSAALIQTEIVSDETTRSVFTTAWLAGAIAAIALFFSAEALSTLFNNHSLARIMRGMAPSVLVQLLGVVSLAFMRRNLEFRTIQIIQTIAYLVGFVIVGIGTATLGYGERSLVLAWNTQCAVSTLFLYLIVRHSVKPLLRIRHLRLYQFGIKATGGNVSNWITENVDNLVVGRVFGPESLGMYSVAYNLVRTPTNHLVTSIQQVTLPLVARATRDQRNVAEGVCAAAAIVAALSMPVFFTLGVMAEWVIAFLYGAEWGGTSELLEPLALAMPVHALMAVAGPVILGVGRAKLEFKVQALSACILASFLAISANISLNAVAWAVLAAYSMRFALVSVALRSAAHTRILEVLSAILSPLAVSILFAYLAWMISNLIEGRDLPLSVHLVVSSVPPIVMSWCTLFFGRRYLFSRKINQYFGMLAEGLRSLKKTNDTNRSGL